MSMFNRSYILALIAAAALAGCSSTPEDTSSAEDATGYGTESSVDGGALGGDYGAAEEPTTEVMDPALSIRVVYFDFDKATVRPDAVATLKAHASYLSKTPSARMRIEGHADERGTREYNMALGERRAKAAASFLAANGASASQLEIISYGEERPMSLGHDNSSWSKNRRSELQYTSEAP